MSHPQLVSALWKHLAMGIIALGLLTGLGAAESKAFDIPAGTADKALKQFIAQSGAEVVYAAEVVRGVSTPTIKGNLTPAEALEQLLAGTALTVRRDERNGTFMIARDPNGQRAAPAPASVRPASNPVAGETVQLSPFVVSDSVETGWIATETLAGTRLRTDFRDIPNQIETLTKEFMNDLAVTNLEEAMSYTANVESVFEYGAGRTSIQAGSRIRSLGNGTLTRNFFTIHNLTDNFNLERVTVASGPNAILFGLGSASGVMDATPARAQMRNHYGFEVQYDSEDSKRGTFDANVVVLPEKFAVRLMGLSKRGFSSIKPNLDRDERLYGTLTFAPFKRTKLILEGERAYRNLNRAIRWAPTDYVTPWLNANRVPGSGYTTARPTYNNTSLATIASDRIFVQHSDAPLLIAGDPGPMRSWRNSVTVRNPAQLSSSGLDPVFDAGLLTTLRDPAIFPFDVNVTGTARTSLLGGITRTAILEQRLADNLFLELAYNAENSYDHRFYSGGAGGVVEWGVWADANQFIPGTTTPNPNLGKFYFQGATPSSLEFEDRKDWRATLSYELDLSRKLSGRGGWGRWLGRHRFAGLYTKSESDIRRQNSFNRRILDEPSLPGMALRPRTFQNWAVHVTRVPQVRHYFDNPYDTPGAAGSFTADWTMTDANGRPYTIYALETPLRAANGQRLAAGAVTSASLNQTNAQIFAWQGFFLPDEKRRDRLVLTYGWRKDSAKSAPLDLDSVKQDFSGLYPLIYDVRYGSYGATQSGINRNVGVVARPLPWLSAFYNQSTTFDLNIGRFDPFGKEIPGAGGDGKDYGVRLDLWSDKVSLRVNRYENTIGPTTATTQVQAFRSYFFALENRVRALDPSIATLGGPRAFPGAGVENYFLMANGRASGYEAELNLTPTSNWNIRLNGAKSEAMESDIGTAWFAWTAARLPVWKALVAKNGEVDAAGRPTTWNTALISSSSPTPLTLEQYYNTTIVGQALAYMAAADGRAINNARPLRGNLITNYRFSEGRLKGFNVGGVVRYRAAPNLGYGTKTSPGGTTIFDLDKEYTGKPETYVDFLAGYRGRMKAFGGFNYRVQLNVRNVLNKNDPVPANALTTGELYRLYLIDSRLFVTSFAVDF